MLGVWAVWGFGPGDGSPAEGSRFSGILVFGGFCLGFLRFRV